MVQFKPAGMELPRLPELLPQVESTTVGVPPGQVTVLTLVVEYSPRMRALLPLVPIADGRTMILQTRPRGSRMPRALS